MSYSLIGEDIEPLNHTVDISMEVILLPFLAIWYILLLRYPPIEPYCGYFDDKFKVFNAKLIFINEIKSL